MSQCWVVDSACSINLSVHHSNSITFTTASDPSTVGGVGVIIQGSGIVRLHIQLQSRAVITRIIHTMFTPDLITRSSHGIMRLLSVSCLQRHCGCEISFPNDTDIGLLNVPT
jgi:hypothetical protein